ncbi:MAG: glycerol-3-phosphate 1-O-acyltransferase PlsY [Firmicutes bacterium]|nr:glycerol-3-phosphate 1-O-acyltransferase PlsY [Bacillota bacterium]
MELLNSLLAVLIAYLLGSVSFAYIITKMKTGKDIRTIGSGSAGTTNTARAVGKKLAMVVMALDILKGVAAVLIGQWLAGDTGGLLGFVFVIVGHMFPVFLEFHGGKGVACGAGACLALSPMVFIPALIAFILPIALTGYVSLGSIMACLALIVTVFVVPEPTLLRVLYLLMACAVLFMHRANIKRLLNGTESKTFYKNK